MKSLNIQYKHIIVNEFSDTIKSARLKNSITLTEASKKIGITIQYLSQIENGVQFGSYLVCERLAKLYNLNKIELAKLKFKQSIAYKEYRKYISKAGKTNQ